MTGTSGGIGELDVLVQGEGVRRDAPVEIGEDGMRLGDMRVPYRELFWTSRRSGLLMLFTPDRTVAVKGSRPELDAVARAVEGRVGGAAGRGRLPAELAEEVILCTAGVAVVGSVAGTAVSGLRVLVATRRGLHLLDGRRDLRLGWPVDEARVSDPDEGRHPGGVLVLRKGDSVVRLLYLFPEEREAVLRAAESDEAGEADPLADGAAPVDLRAPEESAGEGAGGVGGAAEGEGPARGGAEESLEMFDRREVAGPVAPELPEFRVSVETLQAGAEDAAERLSRQRVRSAGLSPHFLETHLLELGEIALGPFLLRKSAACAARGLDRALEAMDPGELWDDTGAAVPNAADRMLEVYERELDRLARGKRAPSRVREEHELSVEEREELRLRLRAPFEKVRRPLRELEDRQRELRRRLEELEGGPPDAAEDDVREAARAWREAVKAVDRGYADQWEEFLDAATETWRDRLLASLGEVGSMRRRRLPEWMSLTLLGAVTLLAAAAAVILLVW